MTSRGKWIFLSFQGLAKNRERVASNKNRIIEKLILVRQLARNLFYTLVAI
jgi:hypothetical protein